MSVHHKTAKILVGISSCLLGEAVRYDGAHKKDTHINRHLANVFSFVPICPEVAIGMGVPRDPIQLVRLADDIRVRGVKNPAVDVTEQLLDFAAQVLNRRQTFYGYIFKARSPSCGLTQVPTFTHRGVPLEADGTGAYAHAIIEQLPQLPVTDEGHLKDKNHRDAFIDRVFTYHHQLTMIKP